MPQHSKLQSLLSALKAIVQVHKRSLTIVFGSIVISIWTVIRHYNNGVNFDVVGQVGLVDQWMHGLHNGAQVGQTNYILKMPFYLLMNSMHFITPNNRLLILALIFNVFTFCLLLLLFEKILDLYKMTNKSWLYMGMLWLATISGRVFWLDYANSRNLETVGGVLFLYLALRILKLPSYLSALLLMAIGGVVFFADILQFFVIGVPICLYVISQWIFMRTNKNGVIAVSICSATLGSYIVAKLLFWFSTVVLPITFISSASVVPALTRSSFTGSLKSIVTSTIKMFDSDFLKSSHSLNSVREFFNAIILAAILYMAIRILLQKQKVAYPKMLILLILAVNYIVYVASGQALQIDKERYLIMVPIMTVLLVAFWGATTTLTFKPKILLIWSASLAVSVVLILGALVTSIPTRYSKDYFKTQTSTFLQVQGFKFAVSSREIGIPATYFDAGRPTIVPTLCSPSHRLQLNTLFFDKASYDAMQKYKGDVPIIIQNDDIKVDSNNCRSFDIIIQFGHPKSVIGIPGVGSALIYEAQTLKLDN